MKLLVLLAVLAIAYLVWRANRVEKKAAPPPQAPAHPPALPQEMVQCAVCAVHLPRGEALDGRDGRLYCSAEHRLLGSGS